ncbi:osmotically inducible protein OsmC [Clostridium sp. MF28]|uniref:OsmC family protein n=1 Tax=Clostridium TaxID=1485 RepID=UPI000CF8EACF|nr:MULTISPECIES: OsmC family protein [Clostridium]AVK49350.1 osmotically inducible protein OsmC [Clostridium sp. MF28]PSM58036.1 osmotically inducible protein OsmC [Clostridium diolis]
MNNIMLDAIIQTEKTVRKDPSSGMTKFNAHLDWEDGTKNNVFIRDFSPIVIDEPDSFGGTNKGPNPVEYILAGAASCFSITFEIFASQEGIKLEKVSVDIEADLDFAVFFGIKEGERGITSPTIKLNAVTSAPIEKVKEIATLALSASVVLNSLKAKVELTVK